MERIIDPTLIVPAVFAALAFLTVIGLALPWLQPDLFATRLKVIRERRAELGRRRQQHLQRPRPVLRLASAAGRVNWMRRILEALPLVDVAEQPELRRKLMQAGWRGPRPLIVFTFLRLALPFGFGGAAALWFFGSPGLAAAPILGAPLCLAAALAGFFLPSVIVRNAVARRQQEIQRTFPDALDLMVICVEAGLSLEAALARMVDELAAAAPALAEEIAITGAELAFLNDRRQALENFAERAGTRPVRSLVTALIQSERYGTPLGQALRVVAQESREARMARAEEKAASLPAKLTVPMVTFFLPVLFLVLIGPTIIQVINTFSR